MTVAALQNNAAMCTYTTGICNIADFYVDSSNPFENCFEDCHTNRFRSDIIHKDLDELYLFRFSVAAMRLR